MEQLSLDFRAQNSREAYREVQPKLSALHHQIMYAMRKIQRGTFYQIADAAGLEPSQVWKRCSELEKAGHITPDGRTMGPNGRSVTVWRLKE